MKLYATKVCITPIEPVLQGGYGTRDHAYEAVHDDLYASIFILEIQDEEYVWISCDLSNGTKTLLDEMIKNLRLQDCNIEKDHIIFAGSHTHSGPNIYVEKEPEKADRNCFKYIAKTIASAVVEAFNEERVEVSTKYSDIVIDGLYSNRNSKIKQCDKHVHVLAFYDQDKLYAMWVCLSHHCTVLGASNYQLTADLFGAMRKILEENYHCEVMMAQGNAADMSNHMYRKEASFKELEYQSHAICKQIIEKMDLVDIDMDSVDHSSYVHTQLYSLDSSKYKKDLENYIKQDSLTDDKETKKWLNSKIRACKRKIALGDGLQLIDMPFEIWDMSQVQIIVVPGELGSVLGLKIKHASYKKPCIIWGYSNGANLGYLVEKEAYEQDSFESNISNYPSGVADDYTESIIKVLKKREQTLR